VSKICFGSGRRHERSAERFNYCKGYRDRGLDTRLGSHEKALAVVIQEAWIGGRFCAKLSAYRGAPIMLGMLKVTLKPFVPEGWVLWYRQRREAALAKKSTEYIFTQVYTKNLWGGRKGEFNSGPGSRGTPADLYVRAIRQFILENSIVSVADLGCGDFAIGRHLSKVCGTYTGVDVVRKLIEKNSQVFGTNSIRFECLDIVQEELPDAELCLVRQVFQHLSNEQIIKVLPKLRKYKYVLVTEHYPDNDKVVAFNIDKIHGADTRLLMGSAVYLDKRPFGVKSTKLILEVPVPKNPDEGDDVAYTGFIRSYLVEL
jgi:hypothetical protein